ncbi:hypothetical protein [Pyrococcus kukulkanii]|uniref:hypothetical protein n=1 Tax=Pyrococcus kukulkanii TaxID=1609559 RepID=UPI001379468C|nr:hypothetical protein [Pyrococcus kukulkanii]
MDSSAIIGLSLGEVLEKVCEVFEVYIPRAVFHELAEVRYCRVGSHELRKLVEIR